MYVTLKERNVLFNAVLPFLLSVFGIGNMVKDHSDNESKLGAIASQAD